MKSASKIEAARIRGLVRGGPEVDTKRCWELVHRAQEEHGIEPSDDAVERFVVELAGAGESPT